MISKMIFSLGAMLSSIAATLMRAVILLLRLAVLHFSMASKILGAVRNVITAEREAYVGGGGGSARLIAAAASVRRTIRLEHCVGGLDIIEERYMTALWAASATWC